MSALNFIFAAHGVIQGALALQLLLLPHVTTFLLPAAMDLTQVLLVRMYGAGVASLAIISLLCRDMPNMLPCKRGAACGFMFYHMIVAFVVFQSRNLGPLSTQATWGITAFHSIQAFILYAWYTATGSQVKAFLKQEKKQDKKKSH